MASLAYDDQKRGDLLSMKMDGLTQMAYKKKAHSTSINVVKPLRKHGGKLFVTSSVDAVVKMWRVGFNAHNHLECLITIDHDPYNNPPLT